MKKAREFPAEFKLKAVKRMLKGENVSALARELEVRRKLLYEWKDNYGRGGMELLRPRGRPLKEITGKYPRPRRPEPEGDKRQIAELTRKVAELERKLGQKELELDFFATALQRIEQDPLLATDASKSSARRRGKAD